MEKYDHEIFYLKVPTRPISIDGRFKTPRSRAFFSLSYILPPATGNTGGFETLLHFVPGQGTLNGSMKIQNGYYKGDEAMGPVSVLMMGKYHHLPGYNK